MQMFIALWSYRNFVLTSAHREFHGKYTESLLGGFWSIANPLTLIAIYTVVLGNLIRPMLHGHEDTPYAFGIYLCAGFITWNLFAEMLGRLTNVFLEHGNIIKKSNFPRICLPAIVTLSALINFAILLLIYLGFIAIIGHWPGWLLFATIPLIALQILFALGLGVLLGTMNVFFRDIGQLTGVVLQFWFWLTPIVYTFSALPEKAQKILALNPLQPLMNAYQTIFLDRALPDFTSLWPLMVLTLIFLFLGAHIFLSRVGEMVDEL